jgi:hypothetical protein
MYSIDKKYMDEQALKQLALQKEKEWLAVMQER